ncbi:hypothetical protein ABWH92_16805 [Ahrensia marina]|uniref:hypothetical protein n=1 Tax=Ahrensia marina TaxID=1514904 RepID=UPI0035D0B335
MSLTHEESLLFATLWLKVSEGAVLELDDASEVATYTAKCTEQGLTPCARERLPQFDTRPAKRPTSHNEHHSSWVH